MLAGLLLLLTITDSCWVATEFRVPSPGGHELAAILEAPDSQVRRPAIILVSGAGPSTRNHFTIPGNSAWQVIAQHFVRAGFAVIRFDEVGTGQSSGDYDAIATTESLASDVESLMKSLRSRPEVDPNRIVLWGWSEGAAISGLVAAQDPQVAGLVLLAPAAWNGRKIMDYQNRWRAMHDSSLLRSSPDQREARYRDLESERMQELWFRHFLTFEPLPPFRRVRAPVFMLHGTEDHSVAVEQSRELLAVLRSNGNRDARLVELAGMDHYFTEPSVSSDPPPFSSQVLGLATQWITARIQPPAISCRVR
jgi:pimeloyl-ACP methyl ester carboxylesterase